MTVPAFLGVSDIWLLLVVLAAYVFAREAGRSSGRGEALHILWDLVAVLLLVLAFAFPRTAAVVPGNIATGFKNAIPAGLVLLGVAWLIDRGWKILAGLALIVIGIAANFGLGLPPPSL